jgi:hypothetical protein
VFQGLLDTAVLPYDCAYVRGGTQKFPELLRIVKKKYLKYLYKFATLIPFEVLPLRLDAAIPAPLPMLETLSTRIAPALDSISFEDVRQCFSNGKGTRNAACSHRGSSLKGTKVSDLNNHFKYNFLTIPGIFAPPPLPRTWGLIVLCDASGTSNVHKLIGSYFILL